MQDDFQYQPHVQGEIYHMFAPADDSTTIKIIVHSEKHEQQPKIEKEMIGNMIILFTCLTPTIFNLSKGNVPSHLISLNQKRSSLQKPSLRQVCESDDQPRELSWFPLPA